MFILLISLARPASAHGEEPRLEINVETLSPGSTLDIRGVGFEFEEQITIHLVGSSTDLSLGMITADPEGGFLLAVNLPPDLREGAYFIRATTDDHKVTSVTFNVRGMTLTEDGGENLREEDDGLLAPMPTLPPGFTSTPIPEAESPAETAAKKDSILLIPGVLMVVALLGMIGFRLMARR